MEKIPYPFGALRLLGAGSPARGAGRWSARIAQVNVQRADANLGHPCALHTLPVIYKLHGRAL